LSIWLKISQKLGFQAYNDFRTPCEAIDFGVKSGFKCVELNGTHPCFFPENIKDSDRRAIKEAPIDVLMHAPADISLFSLHKNISNASVARLKEFIDFVIECNIKNLTVHIGSTFRVALGEKITYIHEVLPELFKEALKRNLQELVNYSLKKSYRISIENAGGFRYQISHEVLEEFLKQEKIYLTWDIGHTNTLINRPAEYQIELTLFKKYKHLIREVHLHDNKGNEDEHNVIGKGNVNFEGYRELLINTPEFYVLEVRPKERAIESKRIIESKLI